MHLAQVEVEGRRIAEAGFSGICPAVARARGAYTRWIGHAIPLHRPRHFVNCKGQVSGKSASSPSRRADIRSIKRSLRWRELNYVELPVRDVAGAKAFYERVFGWTMTEFGPTYAATLTGDTDVGLQGDPDEATRAPLPVIEVADLEAALEAVTAGGWHDRPPDLRLSRRQTLPVPRSRRQRDGLR